jgi:hypothetical protein
MTARMTFLKYWNSGVESNGSAFILSPLGYGVSFRAPAVSEKGLLRPSSWFLPVNYLYVTRRPTICFITPTKRSASVDWRLL